MLKRRSKNALTVARPRRSRLISFEDRYMRLYGQEDWESSNMVLQIGFAPEDEISIKAQVRDKILARANDGDPHSALLREAVDENSGPELAFRESPSVTLEELASPRRGLYFDFSEPGKIVVIWNHIQTDGVGMWRAIRPIFDANPPLVPYREIKPPPRVIPEMLAIPSVARRLMWRGKLRPRPQGAGIQRSFTIWDAETIRAVRQAAGGVPFNLTSSALAVSGVFERHLDRNMLTVGITAYFPFLLSRNKYAVLLCKVRRDTVSGIARQLAEQTKHRMKCWGQSSVHTLALTRMPAPLFRKVVTYYRGQIDVLISSLPVARYAPRIAELPATISCHPVELTIPYYFLMLGTKEEIHVSTTSRYDIPASFPPGVPAPAALG